MSRLSENYKAGGRKMKTSQLGVMTARQEINLDIFIACQENNKN